MARRGNYYGWTNNPAPERRAGSYRRQYGTSWWGKQFLAALNEADYSGRLGRGKTYANKGLVDSLEMTLDGCVSAAVQGSRTRPYQITMHWKPWSEKKRNKLVADIAQRPDIMGHLLAGKLPETLHVLLTNHGLHIFPRTFNELAPDCSCPDWSVPCKHLAAVCYVLAGAIDADPFALFELRGLDLRAALLAGANTEEAAPPPIRPLTDWLRPVAAARPFAWDAGRYATLDFSAIADQGLRAVNRLPDNAPFDSAGGFLAFLQKIYLRTSRYAGRVWRKESIAVPEAAEVLPVGVRLELHLRGDLHLHELLAFGEADEVRLLIHSEADLLDWLLDLEQLEPRYLDKRSKSLLAAFQLARTLAQRMAYLPRLLAAGPGASKHHIIEYVPSDADPKMRELLEDFSSLCSPNLLYVIDGAGTHFEFAPAREGEQLAAALLGMFIREATAGQEEENPARRLFLLNGYQQFTLVGTEEFPAAVQRYLDRLHLGDLRFAPVLQIEETPTGLSVSVLIDDREAPTALPTVLADWLPSAATSDRLEVLKVLSLLSDDFTELADYLATGGAEAMTFSVAGFTPVLTKILPGLEALGVRVLVPKVLKKLLRPALGLSAETAASEVFELSGLISLDNIVRFKWQAAIGDTAIDETAFRELIKKSKGLVRFRDGYALINEQEAAKLLAKMDEGEPELAPHERLQVLFTEEYEGASVRLSPALRALIDRTRNAPQAPLPEGLRATLRPYQLRGYSWLYANAKFGLGSVLADDMGLGKTLQVITLLLRYREDGLLDKEKALVIVPTSLLGNWLREIERFAPELRAQIYHGPQRKLPAPAAYDVLLTTYGVLRSEALKLSKLPWRVSVIDEAQNIKNPKAKQTKAVLKVAAPVRIAMSGTPVENRLLDYWSLLGYTLPKFLGSRKHFNEAYARPIQGERDQAAADRFRKLTAPFVLRRLKTDKTIISDLPDKVVQTEHCRLTPEQAALYEGIVQENLEAVERTDSTITRQGLVLKLITALKQCCNHPAQFLGQPAATFGESGKAALLQERLTGILDNGDKALIFTQYRQMGDLLQGMIRDAFGVEVPFLHGGSSTKAREAMVARFQTDADCPLFLISIKAGGTGLNLTAANHVIHYDLWWNPAVEAQATDRAYRIGQERTVFVHRFVTEKTFEEKIDALIRSKQDLADLSVVAGETSIGKMTDRELRELVRMG